MARANTPVHANNTKRQKRPRRILDAPVALNMQDVFATTGPVARCFMAFEDRPQQVQMAKEVQETLANGGHLVAEADTGVGKSFGYLVPAIEQITRSKAKVLVSTFTITLQEQLINKDIPLLASCMSELIGGFTAVLAKGRGNYLCKRRLEFALRRQKGLFDRFGATLEQIKTWADQTKDGSLSTLQFIPLSNVWDSIKSEHGNCRGRRCPHFKGCFYLHARRQLDNADMIIANHALMFSDLVLKDQGTSLLPDYQLVIIDEAHNLEHVAEEHFGINISNRQIKALLDSLYSTQTHKGVLSYLSPQIDTGRAIDTTIKTQKQIKTFFAQIHNWLTKTTAQTNGRCQKGFIQDDLSKHLNALKRELARLSQKTQDADEKLEIMRYVDRCASIGQNLECFLAQSRDNYVYWVETSNGTKTSIHLRSAPINVAEDIRKTFFDKYRSIILTSATLSCGPLKTGEGFKFFADRVGLKDFKALQLGSPFDYKRQVTIYIEKDLPNPNEPHFAEKASEALKKYILKTEGRAFVLFTSYAMLEEVAHRISEWLSDNSIELLQQGAGQDRSTLLERFKCGPKSILLGTDSFWQGVDVPGDALCNVIIVRLPFDVPDQPLLAGRLEKIRQAGRDPFYEYQLPSAIIKFKQGFGRLIRTRTDSGIIVILDSRIINRSYGSRFLQAIPTCKIEIVSSNRTD